MQDKMNQVTMVYIVAGEATQLIMNAMILTMILIKQGS